MDQSELSGHPATRLLTARVMGVHPVECVYLDFIFTVPVILSTETVTLDYILFTAVLHTDCYC